MFANEQYVDQFCDVVFGMIEVVHDENRPHTGYQQDALPLTVTGTVALALPP